MKTEQNIDDYTIVFFNNDIEYAYYKGRPIEVSDIPDDVYDQIDFEPVRRIEPCCSC